MQYVHSLRIISTLGAAVVLFSFGSCATDQAAKVRSDRPATVGVWGVGYRPNSNVGFVSDLSGSVTAESNTRHVDDDGNIKDSAGDKPNSQNIYSKDSQKIDLGLHIYPSQRSAFFYGVGVNRRKSTSKFDSPNVGSTLTNPSYSNVEVSDDIIAVGPSLGWDWIWPNGVSALLDVGPRWDVSKSRRINDDSDETSNVDTAQRDKLLGKLDNSKFTLLEPRLIVGYSF